MRPEFAAMLEKLVRTNREVELEINERRNRFPMPARCVVEDWEEFQDLIARFFRQLFCPDLKESSDWKTEREFLNAEAFHLLEREYGPNGRTRACDLARSGAEGGLLAVLRKLAELLQRELFKRRALAIVDPYWQSTPAEQLVQDARDYVDEYRRVLPPEMAEGVGAPILVEFHKVLLHHPVFVREMRLAVRW